MTATSRPGADTVSNRVADETRDKYIRIYSGHDYLDRVEARRGEPLCAAARAIASWPWGLVDPISINCKAWDV